MDNLTGQTAFVTGALGDLGGSVSTFLLRAGATVVGLGRSPQAHVAERIEALQAIGPFEYVAADVTDHAALARTIDALPRLDIVIGNAGTVEPASFVDVTEESLARQVSINFTANYVLGQIAARRFIRDGTPGRIVYIGSWVGERPWPELTAYSASKAALQMLTRSMALELAPYGIRVNLVAPGIVHAGLARKQAEADPVYAARAARAIPLGSLQRPDDVAAMVLFLVGEGAANATGASFVVDGGASLGSF
jgi:NAD(P)-dependent dehydrogenase (short-subunit alcohol dehydrogenase family)